jgi:hypothetical protein
MIRQPMADEADCTGPAYDARGELSAECRACGKCDAVARLMRDLAPAVRMNNETMRPATHAAR